MSMIARCVLLSMVFAVPATAATQDWDQEKVTAIAQQLADQVNTISTDLRKLNPPPVGQNRRAHHAAIEDIRLLRNTTRHLATRLGDGDGLDKTLPIYRRIQLLRRDAANNIAQASSLPDDVAATLDKGRDLLLQLSVYYEDA